MAFKVQPWTLFKASFSTFWMQQKTLLVIAVVPVLVLLSAGSIGLLLFLRIPDVSHPTAYTVFILVLVALPVLYTSLSIYLSWYRYMFRLEEKPQWFRLDFMRHVRLFWAILKALIFAGLPVLAVFVAGAVGGLFDSENGPSENLAKMTLWLALPIAWFAFAMTRLGLYLPAVALDEPVKLRTAFGETRGNFWRLFALAFLVALLNVLNQILDWMLPVTSESIAVLAANLVGTLLILWLSFGVSLTSSAELYRAWLVAKMEPQDQLGTSA
jgi:hypothetical protein